MTPQEILQFLAAGGDPNTLDQADQVTFRSMTLGQPAPPRGDQIPPSRAPGVPAEGVVNTMTPEVVSSGILRGAGLAAGMMPGAGVPMMAFRTLLPALSEAAATYKDTGDPLEALKQGGISGALGGGVELGVPAARHLINRMGYGLALTPAKQAMTATGALGRRQHQAGFRAAMREGIRPGLFPSATSDFRDALKGGRSGLEAAENASTATTKLGSLRPTLPDLPTDRPYTRERTATNYLNKAFSETAGKSLGLPETEFRDLMIKQPPKAGFMPGSAAPPTKVTPAQDAALERLGILPDDWAAMPLDDRFKALDEVDLTTRQVGEFKRGVGKRATSARDLRQSGQLTSKAEHMSEAAELTEQMARARQHGPLDQGKKPGWQTQLFGERPKPGETGAITAADKNLSDLYALTGAQDAMRQSGLAVGTGAAGSRIALGMMAARLMGMDPKFGTALAVGAIPEAWWGVSSSLKPLARTGLAGTRLRKIWSEPMTNDNESR
jgi:hypothetical protein